MVGAIRPPGGREDRPYFTSPEHQRYRTMVVRDIALHSINESGKLIPERVLMVGDDWAYKLSVRHIGEPGPKAEEGISFGRPFGQSDTYLYGWEPSQSIAEAIDTFWPGEKELSLVPDGQKRMEEARGLGQVIDEAAYGFTMMRGSQRIVVYKRRDTTTLIKETGDGPGGPYIGWTMLKSPDKTRQ